MERGSLGSKWTDRKMVFEKTLEIMDKRRGLKDMIRHPLTAQMFGNAALEHMEKCGSKPIHFAKIGYKNHKHSINNPRSQFQKE